MTWSEVVLYSIGKWNTVSNTILLYMGFRWGVIGNETYVYTLRQARETVVGFWQGYKKARQMSNRERAQANKAAYDRWKYGAKYITYYPCNETYTIEVDPGIHAMFYGSSDRWVFREVKYKGNMVDFIEWLVKRRDPSLWQLDTHT